MGTLFNQGIRRRLESDEKFEVERIIDIAFMNEISIAEVVAILEYSEKKRANELMVNNQDVMDEQLAGFGELLKDIATSLEVIANKEQEEV